jgi:hypothetical protein
MSSDCTSIALDLLNKTHEITSLEGNLNTARQAYAQAGCANHYTTTKNCAKLQEAINSASSKVKTAKKQAETIHLTFKQHGCDDTSNCDNAGVNFLGCVSIPLSTCETNREYKNRCCEQRTQLIYINNVISAVETRKTLIKNCIDTKKGLVDSAKASMDTWTTHPTGTSSSIDYQNDQIYNAFKTSLVIAIANYNLDTGSSLGSTETGAGPARRVEVTNLPATDSAVSQFGNLFYNHATSPSTFARILNISLPSPIASGGPTSFDVPGLPKCSGVTEIPSQTFHCFSVEEFNKMEALGNQVNEYMKKKFLNAASFNSKIFSFTGNPPSPKLLRSRMGRIRTEISKVAKEAFDEAIKEYNAQYTKQISDLNKLDEYMQGLLKKKKNIIAEGAAIDEEITFHAKTNKDSIEHGLIQVIQNNIVESVLTTHTEPCGSKIIAKHYPLATGTFGPQFFTTTDAAAMTRFDVGGGVAQLYPEDGACCIARGDKAGSYSYPVTLSATVKIVLDEDAIAKAKTFQGIVDLVPAEQDALLNDLNGCTKSITYCLGESS